MDNEFNGGKRGGKTENIYRELENWISTFTPKQKREIEKELEQEKDDEEDSIKFSDIKFVNWDSSWYNNSIITNSYSYNTNTPKFIVFNPAPLEKTPVIEDNVQDVDFSEE